MPIMLGMPVMPGSMTCDCCPAKCQSGDRLPWAGCGRRGQTRPVLCLCILVAYPDGLLTRARSLEPPWASTTLSGRCVCWSPCNSRQRRRLSGWSSVSWPWPTTRWAMQCGQPCTQACTCKVLVFCGREGGRRWRQCCAGVVWAGMSALPLQLAPDAHPRVNMVCAGVCA